MQKPFSPGCVDSADPYSQIGSSLLSSELKAEYENQLTDLQAEIVNLKSELAAREIELDHWRQRHHVLTSFRKSLAQSWSWKLLEPLRAVRRLLKPRGFDSTALIAWQQLEPGSDGPRGSWVSTGMDPQFVVPCLLPAGWARIRLRMKSAVQGRLELFVDRGEGFDATTCIERINIGKEVDRDFFVHFSSPVFAVRMDPLDVEGEFQLETLRVDPIPWPQAFLQAIGSKVRLLWEYGQITKAMKNGLGMLMRGQLGRILSKIFLGLNRSTTLPVTSYDVNRAYEIWRRRHALTDADRQRLRVEAGAMIDPPLISVIMPVYNVAVDYLRLAVDSVLRQTYPHWELCIADDASPAPHVRSILDEYARCDPRIRVVYRNERGNIGAASNSALELARGEYVALLDHDDELAEQALFRVAQTIVADRELDMLYSDEDKLELDGRHVDPFFKPDWSPEYFLACMYTCHLGVYRAALVRDVGGFRSEFDTAQDYDLALRIVARTSRIGHIPDILYHWRKAPHSTAVSANAKPQAHITARRALQSYLDTIGRQGLVGAGPAKGFHRVRYALIGRPRISIVIPTGCRSARIRGKDTTYLAHCIQSIRQKSTYKNYEILAIDNDDMPAELERELDRWQIRRVSYTDAFNLASKINLGAAKAEGDYLLILNDDVEVISPDWLECMLEYSQQPEIGAVGAKLLFPDGRLQHVGITIQDGNPGHPYYGAPGNSLGYYCGNVVARNYSAVTGACMMTRAELFHRLGGFDEALPLNYNDVDFCLRVVGSGLRIVCTPYAQLYHHEAATKTGVYPHELEAFKQRWGTRWPRDPYFNPNLCPRHSDYRIQLVSGSLVSGEW